ncbi:MAG: trypsin-like peptidase domain-containing protein [Elusimicrobia bacterium]|nr:trypsin-like peptidase domain-containing protein [Elusimicrobiota bacterium]
MRILLASALAALASPARAGLVPVPATPTPVPAPHTAPATAPPQTAPQIVERMRATPLGVHGKAPDHVPFTPLDKLPAQGAPAGYERAKSAVGRIYLATNCTATRVSPQGHILTAFHCVPNCLPDDSVSWKEDGKIYKLRFDESKLPGGECKSHPWTGTDKADPGNVWKKKYRLLAVGSSGYLRVRAVSSLPYQNPATFLRLRAEGHTAIGDVDDFALLQEVEPEPGAPFIKPSCGGLPATSELLWAISFPYNGRDYLPRYTAGYRIDKMEDTAIIDEVRSGKIKEADARAIFFDPRFLWSSLDAASGASGSGVFDQKGELVSVTALKYTGGGWTYHSGSHGSIPISHIRARLLPKLPPAVYQTVFGCD